MASALNQGIYDVSEAARLLHVHPEWLNRWALGKKAIIPPTLAPAFSFHDLVSLLVVKQLWDRDVDVDDVRRAHAYLAEEYDVDRPFAHREAQKRLSTVGTSLTADLGEITDIGRRGQTMFRSVAEPLLRALEYDTNLMTNLWRPRKRVCLNPRIQAGTPCVDKRRVPTGLIAGMVAAGDERRAVADDFDLALADVNAAVSFEESLAA